MSSPNETSVALDRCVVNFLGCFQAVVTGATVVAGKTVETTAVERTVVEVVATVDADEPGELLATVVVTGDAVVVAESRRVGPVATTDGVAPPTVGGTVITTTMDTGGELETGTGVSACWSDDKVLVASERSASSLSIFR